MGNEMTENEKLLFAIDRMMVGGNHIALIVPQYVQYGMTHDEASKLIWANGDGVKEYESFCAWKCIMETRDFLENNGIIK